jgi:hypothetical protein
MKLLKSPTTIAGSCRRRSPDRPETPAEGDKPTAATIIAWMSCQKNATMAASVPVQRDVEGEAEPGCLQPAEEARLIR